MMVLHLKKFPLLLGCLLWGLSAAQAQSVSERQLSISSDQSTLSQLAAQIARLSNTTIYVPPNLKENATAGFDVADQSLSTVLDLILEPLGLGALYHRNSFVVIVDRSDLEQNYSAEYYQALEESIEAAQEEDLQEIIVGSIDELTTSGETRLVGLVTDIETGDPVIGATILVEGSNEGTASEVDGSYVLDLRAGSYMLVVQYIGYQTKRIPVKIISSGSLDFQVAKSEVLLDEVVVQAQAKDANIRSTQVGVTRLSTKEIEKLPSFLGEVDIIKGLLLQPGISTIGEGASGFNVRGGNVDQNLIMIDEGIIFNASHALGFFSSFNSDIVSEAILYKGTMPAIYGGRLASALDVKVRDGSFDRWHLKGGLGLVSSRINLDGPIKEGKTSLLLSGRSTYSNWLLKQVKLPAVKNSSAYFYDINARLVHRFNEKNNLTISGYLTEDQFSFNQDFGFDYSTAMAQLEYRKVLGELTLATTNVVWSRYLSQQDDLEGLDASAYQTGLEYLKFKQNINYLGDQFQMNVGVSAINYQVNGNSIVPTQQLSTITAETLQEEQAIEWAAYADFDWRISARFSLIGGIRYSLFQNLGPFDSYLYEDPENPSVEGIVEPTTFDDRVTATYNNFQPRLSFRYNVSPNSSIKGGYGRTAQYINQIYNSETPTPTNFWKLSNRYIRPQLAHNFSLGYFHNFSNNLWVTSIEGFYRDIDELFDYRGFADLLVNDHLETELLRGIGRTYGVELSINRQVGYVHGWLNYTYSRSERLVDGINDGQWYPSNFDKPHDLNLITNFQINKRNSISFNFSFGTGRPITVPVSRYLIQDRLLVLNYSDRNIFRIPDYHRLDVSYTLAQGFRKSKKFKTSWTLSVYNLYGRRNAYSVFVQQQPSGATRIKRLAVLGSAFPSLTFNFELL